MIAYEIIIKCMMKKEREDSVPMWFVSVLVVAKEKLLLVAPTTTLFLGKGKFGTGTRQFNN